MKNVNYTPEMTAQIVSDYEAGAKPKATTRKSDEPTKKELLNQLEAVYPFDVNDLTGATKNGIQDLLSHFSD